MTVIDVQQHREIVGDNIPIHLWLMIMPESTFLWVGDASQRLDSLSMAIKTKYSEMPIGTELLGSGTNPFGKVLAERLSKRSGHVFFVSYNVPSDSPMIEEMAQMAIITRLKLSHPAFGGTSASGTPS
eukprot:c52482_g1_i1.p1 GENE.c52482_g1_i1~~c52482_g1_i1.p1  ORF type:complete len:128 (+),score=27.10 c52482_g1_i1:42-425(+)